MNSLEGVALLISDLCHTYFMTRMMKPWLRTLLACAMAFWLAWCPSLQDAARLSFHGKLAWPCMACGPEVPSCTCVMRGW